MQALILVDLQNDFLPGGTLAVPEGHQVVPVANRLLPRFGLVVATKDWHPAQHGSFASQHPGRKVGEVIDLHGLPQTLWPDHCVQGTAGAEFATSLNVAGVHHVVLKGTDPGLDSYSGFFDNGHRQPTGLADCLRDRGVAEVCILGLATDYCVQFTALDARALGFAVTLIADGCRAVDLRPGDGARACETMQRAGIRIVQSGDVTTASA